MITIEEIYHGMPCDMCGEWATKIVDLSEWKTICLGKIGLCVKCAREIAELLGEDEDDES